MTRPTVLDALDLGAWHKNREKAVEILEDAALGLTTADNIDAEQRATLARCFAVQPDTEEAGENLLRVVGFTYMSEGLDWCFATDAEGQFRVFTLSDDGLPHAEGATFHFWDKHDNRQNFHDWEDYHRELMLQQLIDADFDSARGYLSSNHPGTLGIAGGLLLREKAAQA